MSARRFRLTRTVKRIRQQCVSASLQQHFLLRQRLQRRGQRLDTSTVIAGSRLAFAEHLQYVRTLAHARLIIALQQFLQLARRHPLAQRGGNLWPDPLRDARILAVRTQNPFQAFGFHHQRAQTAPRAPTFHGVPRHIPQPPEPFRGPAYRHTFERPFAIRSQRLVVNCQQADLSFYRVAGGASLPVGPAQDHFQHVQSGLVVSGRQQQRGDHPRIQVPAMLFDGGVRSAVPIAHLVRRLNR